MHNPIEPYLAMLRKELATSLMPKDDDNAKRTATYCYRILTQLLFRSNALPALQQKALSQLDGLLDELNALLRTIDSGMVLTGELTQNIRNRPNYDLAELAIQNTVRVLLSNTSVTGNKLLQQIAVVLFDMQEAIRQATLSVEIKPDDGDSRDGPPLDEAQKQALQVYLQRKFAEESELEVGTVKAIVGGGSKQTLIVELRHTQQLPETVVVRADQAAGSVESTVIDEYHLIETLYAAGMPVPQPFAVETDTSILGFPFVVVSRLEGRIIGDHIQIYEPSESFGLSLARTMGKMHQIPPEQFGDRVPGAKTTTLERVRQDIANFEATWRNSGQPSIALELTYAWLKDHMQFAEGRRVLNHCDLGCHNILVKDGQLSALLDWETATIGNPARDLAHVYNLVVQMMPWDEFLAEYEKAGGTIPSTAEFDFYSLLTDAWKMAIVFVVRSFFHSGISSSMVYAYAVQHLCPPVEHNLYKVLNQVYAHY